MSKSSFLRTASLVVLGAALSMPLAAQAAEKAPKDKADATATTQQQPAPHRAKARAHHAAKPVKADDKAEKSH